MAREIIDGLRFVTGDSYLRVLVVFIAVANMALIGFLSLKVVFLVRTVGVPPAVIGGLVAATSAGGLIGALIATRITRRIGTARGLLATVTLTFPLELLVPLTSQGLWLTFLIIGYLATGASVTIAAIICRSFWQTYCPPRLLGRVIATLQFLTQGAVPLGALPAASPIRRHINLPTSTTTE